MATDRALAAARKRFPHGSSVIYSFGKVTLRGETSGVAYRGELHPETIYVPCKLEGKQDSFPITNLFLAEEFDDIEDDPVLAEL